MLALQEVDQYDEFWAPWLIDRGYGGVWKCRTAVTANKKDGCGLFYKLDKFDLVAKREIEYNDIAFGRPAGSERRAGGGVGDASRSSDGAVSATSTVPTEMQTHLRDCVGVLALLRAKQRPEHHSGLVLVASTHLFWDPRHADVKIAQAERLLAEAGCFLADNARRMGVDAVDDENAASRATKTTTPAIVIAGDFNSVPGSEVHARMLRGIDGFGGGAGLVSAYAAALAGGRVERPRGGAGEKRKAGEDAECRQPTGAGASTWTPAVGSHGEPPHTNVTPGFTDCIDYVFVSDDVAVEAAEALPAIEAVAAGLPDHAHGSDHLPLTVTLAL